MKYQICKSCGENVDNCECSGMYEWLDFKNIKPVCGQKIRVKRVQIEDIEYKSNSGEIPENSKVLAIKDCWFESWTPIY